MKSICNAVAVRLKEEGTIQVLFSLLTKGEENDFRKNLGFFAISDQGKG